MIYIITHKKVNVPQMDNYRILEVGSSLHEHTEPDYLHDNDGINISDRNPNYCELTGLYWIWKNCDDPYKGLVHYRRFFGKRSLRNRYEDIYTYDQLVDMLKDADILTSYEEIYKENAENQLLRSSCTLKNFNTLKQVVSDLYPDYMSDFDAFFHQNKAVQFNMMFCSEEYFDDYCTWLFNILFEMEKHADLHDATEYQKRIYGFLGERLLNVWILHHHMRVKTLNVINPESSLKDRITLVRRRCTNSIQYTLKKESHS